MQADISKQSKKDMIKKMINESKSNEEIAKVTNTSLAYVRKIRSMLKKSNDMVNESNMELTREERKGIYNAFKEGKRPNDVIEEYGFKKEDVEEEYLFYLQYADQEFNIDRFQRDIIKYYSNYKDYIEDDCKKLLNIATKRLLTEKELINLIKSLSTTYYNRGYKQGRINLVNAMMRGDECLPGWDNIRCNVCHKPLHSAMINPKSALGRYILQKCKDWGHSRCHEE